MSISKLVRISQRFRRSDHTRVDGGGGGWCLEDEVEPASPLGPALLRPPLCPLVGKDLSVFKNGHGPAYPPNPSVIAPKESCNWIILLALAFADFLADFW